MGKTKCLWCGQEFDWDDSMYKFCDRCSHNIEVIGADIDKIEFALSKK